MVTFKLNFKLNVSGYAPRVPFCVKHCPCAQVTQFKNVVILNSNFSSPFGPFVTYIHLYPTQSGTAHEIELDFVLSCCCFGQNSLWGSWPVTCWCRCCFGCCGRWGCFLQVNHCSSLTPLWPSDGSHIVPLFYLLYDVLMRPDHYHTVYLRLISRVSLSDSFQLCKKNTPTTLLYKITSNQVETFINEMCNIYKCITVQHRK